jgi:hypothetical protein
VNTGGYRTKDALGETCTPYLIADLPPFIQSEDPPVYLRFDQDAVEPTHRCERCLGFDRFLNKRARLFTSSKWDGQDGKVPR